MSDKRFLYLPIEIKSITEDGKFTGVANLMEVVDLVNDNIHRGSFTKTLTESGGKVFLLADHDESLDSRIGVVYLRENGDVLEVVEGVFNLEKQAGRDAYNDAKFYHEHGIPLGLSIGYGIPKGKSEIKDGIRHIYEIKLYEVSLVAFPANQFSLVEGVKAMKDTKLTESLGVKANEYLTTLQGVLNYEQLYNERWRLTDALTTVMYNLMNDDDLLPEEKVSLFDAALEQFRVLMVRWMMQMTSIDAKADTAQREVKSRLIKAGKVISDANMQKLTSAKDAIQAVIDAATDSKSALSNGQEPGSPTPDAKAAIPPDEPGDHSDGATLLAELKGIASDLKQQNLLRELRSFGATLSN
jgi:HK97 family phage prohead protease